MLETLDERISLVRTLFTNIRSLLPKSIGSIASGFTEIDVLMNANGLQNSKRIMID